MGLSVVKKWICLSAALLFSGLICIGQQPHAYWQSRTQISIAAIGSVTVDQTCTQQKFAAGTAFTSTTNLTPVSASANAVVAIVVWESGTTTSRSVTWGGSSMTAVTNGKAGASGTNDVNIYAINGAISTGSGVTLAGSWTNSAETMVCAVSLIGVNATFGTAFTGSNSGNAQGPSASPTLSVTSATNHIVIGGMINNAGVTISATGNTQLFRDNTGAVRNAAGESASGAASVSVSFTQTSDIYGIAAVDVSF